MSWFKRLVFRFTALFRRRNLEAEMAEEMRQHLDVLTESNIAAGMTPAAALELAKRRFGHEDGLKEAAREEWSWVWLEHRWRDLRYSVHALRRSPGFTATVIATLALSLGANTAILSALQSLFLKPLPYRASGQLVEIYLSLPKAGITKLPLSVAHYADYKANADLFEGVALWQPWVVNMDGNAYPVRVTGVKSTADYFALLDLQPLLGRFFTLKESNPGQDHVVVLTQTFWENRFAADPTVIGREIRLSGEPFTVIGVAPRRLEALNADLAFLKPFEFLPRQTEPKARSQWIGRVYARIKTGVPLSLAEAQLIGLENRYWSTVAAPEERAIRDLGGDRLVLNRIRTEQLRSVKDGLLLLQGAAFLVLVLGIVNVANLMLARTNSRQPEFAIRHTLGAGRRAIILQLLTESLVLVGMGGLVGLALAFASIHVLNSYKTALVREAPPITMDGPVLGATLLATVGAVLIIGLLPIVRLWQGESWSSRQDDSRSSTATQGVRKVGGYLVVAQVAFALMVLVGATLLIQSYVRVLAIAPGFDPKTVLHARIALGTTYKNQTARKAVRDRILDALREVPGVQSVSLLSGNPVEGEFAPHGLKIRGGVLAGVPSQTPTTNLLQVSADFFSTLGIRIIEGRGFTEADARSPIRVYIVDRSFAETYFPGRSAVGEKFEISGPAEQWPTIIGVAESARFTRADEITGRPIVYSPTSYAADTFSVVLRTTRSALDLAPLLREKVRGIDPTVAVEAIQRFDAVLDHLVETRRGLMALLGAFAFLALLLATVGIYGLLSYDVSRRTREIAVRAAIGATSGQIYRLILVQGLGKVGVGLVLGLIGAFYFTRFMPALLFGVQPWNPFAYLIVSALLLAVAFLSSWLPARRASRIDPLVALRSE